MTWTRFYDMHSGGKCKLPPWETIYIEAPMRDAVRIFEGRFGRDPHNVTCDCCGEDYSISGDAPDAGDRTDPSVLIIKEAASEDE